LTRVEAPSDASTGRPKAAREEPCGRTTVLCLRRQSDPNARAARAPPQGAATPRGWTKREATAIWRVQETGHGERGPARGRTLVDLQSARAQAQQLARARVARAGSRFGCARAHALGCGRAGLLKRSRGRHMRRCGGGRPAVRPHTSGDASPDMQKGHKEAPPQGERERPRSSTAVLRHRVRALRHRMLGQLPREHQLHRGLDVSVGQGLALGGAKQLRPRSQHGRRCRS